MANGSYQEMKAEVTEVPASQLILDGGHNATGKKIAHKEPLIKENSSQGMYYIGALGYDIIVRFCRHLP